MSGQEQIKAKDISPRLLRAHLADSIRQRRKSLGMTQQELADMAHMNRTVIANIETVKSNTQLIVLYRIALALHCGVSELLPPVPIIASEWRAVRPPRPLTGRKRRARA